MSKEVLIGDRFNYNILGGDFELFELSSEEGQRIKEIFASARPSKSTDKFGSIVYLGTGGSIERLNEVKEIFENPEMFLNLYPITPYWEEVSKINKE
jgi:hypothetical protein